jgi:hypothetical protein
VKNDRAALAQDLAKGLIAQFEVDPTLAGPLKSDYLYLAEVIIDAIERGGADSET